MRWEVLNLQLEIPHKHTDDATQLNVGKLLSNAPMSTSTERLISTLGTLADFTKPVINRLAANVLVLVESLLGNTFRIRPTRGVPFGGVLPDAGVHLGDDRRGEDEVTFGNNVGASVI